MWHIPFKQANKIYSNWKAYEVWNNSQYKYSLTWSPVHKKDSKWIHDFCELIEQVL